MIVMIAHLSDMRLAMGVDHFISGWVLFGLVVLLLFWVGSFWREDEAAGEAAPASGPVATADNRRLTTVAAICLAIIIAWPVFAQVRENQSMQAGDIALAPVAPAAGWRLAGQPLSQWRPRYIGADAELEQTYISAAGKVSLNLAYYRYQRQGAELINSQNVMVVQKHPVWRQVADDVAELTVHDKALQVRRSKLRSVHGQNLLILYWDWIGGQFVTNPYVAKVLEARQTLLGQRRDAAAIILAAEYGDDADRQAALIQKFVDDMLPSIEASLSGMDAD